MTRYPHQPQNTRRQGQTNNSYKTSIIVTSVWVTVEGEMKVSNGLDNMRPQNRQSIFPGKCHMPIREQQLKLGGVLPVSIASECKGPVVGKTEEASEIKLKTDPLRSPLRTRLYPEKKNYGSGIKIELDNDDRNEKKVPINMGERIQGRKSKKSSHHTFLNSI